MSIIRSNNSSIENIALRGLHDYVVLKMVYWTDLFKELLEKEKEKDPVNWEKNISDQLNNEVEFTFYFDITPPSGKKVSEKGFVNVKWSDILLLDIDRCWKEKSESNLKNLKKKVWDSIKAYSSYFHIAYEPVSFPEDFRLTDLSIKKEDIIDE